MKRREFSLSAAAAVASFCGHFASGAARCSASAPVQRRAKDFQKLSKPAPTEAPRAR